MKRAHLDRIKSSVQENVAKVKHFVPDYTNEEQTKKSLVEPLIEVLGYSLRDVKQVYLEYRVGKSRDRIDYAIMQDNTPVIFVEAKPHNETINDRNGKLVDKALSYGNRTPSVDFVALTNGERWMWFKRKNSNQKNKRKRSLFENNPFLDSNFLQPDDSVVFFLDAISKENYETENAFKLAAELKFSAESWEEKSFIFSTESLWNIGLDDLSKELQRNLNGRKCAWRKKGKSKWKIENNGYILSEQVICYLADQHKGGAKQYLSECAKRSSMIQKISRNEQFSSLEIEGGKTRYRVEKKGFSPRSRVRHLNKLAYFVDKGKGRYPLSEFVDIRIPNPRKVVE